MGFLQLLNSGPTLLLAYILVRWALNMTQTILRTAFLIWDGEKGKENGLLWFLMEITAMMELVLSIVRRKAR